VVAFRKTYSLYRRTKPYPQFKEIGAQALGLNYSLIAFAVTGIFVSAAYTALLPVLAGLTVSLLRTAEPIVAAAPIPKPMAPPWAVPRGYPPRQAPPSKTRLSPISSL